MNKWVAVDVDHVRRSATKISDYGHDLIELTRRLATDITPVPGWGDEHGGATFASVYAEITELAFHKYGLLATDLDDLAANLRRIAVEWEGSDDRAGTMIGKIGRGL
ncbi:WXG100 family type VII secretion target [Plantactinospora soyae]|uniref:Uncharacterized protein YukE n=1 Tax=Plantactinospora soyae TaxID=1544732 RepID=A0A927M914_9ACTN|nr:type VII secretion target [Plantactinospora soyae]MBE1487568.1 uncharacterized protein YukE [Plantactinospora soyae]